MAEKYYLAVPRKNGHRTSGMWASMAEDEEEKGKEEDTPPNILIVDLEDLETEEQLAVGEAFTDSEVGLVSMAVDKHRYDDMLRRVGH